VIGGIGTVLVETSDKREHCSNTHFGVHLKRGRYYFIHHITPRIAAPSIHGNTEEEWGRTVGTFGSLSIGVSLGGSTMGIGAGGRGVGEGAGVTSGGCSSCCGGPMNR